VYFDRSTRYKNAIGLSIIVPDTSPNEKGVISEPFTKKAPDEKAC
jgi:hypothetical protein